MQTYTLGMRNALSVLVYVCHGVIINIAVFVLKFKFVFHEDIFKQY